MSIFGWEVQHVECPLSSESQGRAVPGQMSKVSLTLLSDSPWVGSIALLLTRSCSPTLQVQRSLLLYVRGTSATRGYH